MHELWRQGGLVRVCGELGHLKLVRWQYAWFFIV